MRSLVVLPHALRARRAAAARAAKVAPGDVLLAIDGIELANNGTVPLRGGGDGGDGSEQHERVSFQHLFCGKHRRWR